MSRKEEGMTILEVVVAITILLIGTTFIVQSNSLTYRYMKEQEFRQQMIFFAAGRMEAALEGIRSFDSRSMVYPYNKFVTTFDNLDPTLVIQFDDNSMKLVPFKVSISVSDQPNVDPVEIYNYRVDLDDD